MGAVIDLAQVRDAKITGCTDRPRLELLVRILTLISDTNTPAQNAKLAAAKRLLEAK